MYDYLCVQTESCGFIFNGIIVKDEENANYYPARRYTTRLKLPHWAERSDIYVHFHTTESLGGDDLYDIPAIL